MTRPATQLESWDLIQPEIPAKQLAVWREFTKVYPDALADFQLAERLGWAINTITPRRGELVEQGIIKPYGVVWNPTTRRNVRTFVLVPE